MPEAPKRPRVWLSVLVAIGIVIAVLVYLAPAAHEPASPPRSVANDQAPRAYFQRMLIREADDIYSTAGSDLAMLGLDGKQLQGIPIAQAYDTTRAKVASVEDARIRRKMLLDLFNATEQ